MGRLGRGTLLSSVTDGRKWWCVRLEEYPRPDRENLKKFQGLLSWGLLIHGGALAPNGEGGGEQREDERGGLLHSGQGAH